MRKIDFLLIGAQKSGTSWLWDKLDQHPDTDLPDEKEIHYFGGVERYSRGPEWYYSHFDGVRPDSVTGEASTSYLYDRIPYWYNDGPQIEYADLPTIPELVAAELPDVRIIAILRDPVDRAISAYRHWMKQGNLSPRLGLRRASMELPRMRILEYGLYTRHLSAWRKTFADDRIQILIFEEDVKGDPENGLRKAYEFLGLDADFMPPDRNREVHRSWTWTRSTIGFYAGPFRRFISHGPVGELLDRHDFLGKFAINRSDIEYLRDNYMPEKTKLEKIIRRNLDVWNYGERLLSESA